MATSKNT